MHFIDRRDGDAGLAIVFGHIGFNEMREHWCPFAEAVPRLAHIQDPFSEIPEQPVNISPDKWLWFVPECENHGMTDENVLAALDAALDWARNAGINSVVTNGIPNTDHGHDTAANRRSDDQRAQFLVRYAADQEMAGDIRIELISLNDVFVRIPIQGNGPDG